MDHEMAVVVDSSHHKQPEQNHSYQYAKENHVHPDPDEKQSKIVQDALNEAPTPSVETRLHPLIEIPAFLFAFGASVVILEQGKDFLVPFAFAVFFVYLIRCVIERIISPILRWIATRKGYRREDSTSSLLTQETTPLLGATRTVRQRERKIWFTVALIIKWLGVLLTLATFILLLYLSISYIESSLQKWIAENVARYKIRSKEVDDELTDWLKTHLHVPLDHSTSLFNEIADYFLTNLPTWALGLQSTLEGIMLFTVFSIFLLPWSVHETKGVLTTEIDRCIQDYILSKSAISLALAGVVWLTFVTLKFPLAFIFFLATFFLNFIPNFGFLVASLLPLPIVLFDPDMSTTVRFLAFVIPLASHLLIGGFLEPYFFSGSMELRPVIVLLSLAFWHQIWGVPGAFLSVPITAALKIILAHIPHPYTKLIAHILGDLGELEE